MMFLFYMFILNIYDFKHIYELHSVVVYSHSFNDIICLDYISLCFRN